MTLRLISVPHTGTVFTRYTLARMGWWDRTQQEGTPEGRMYHSHHTDEEGYPVPFTADSRIVVPLRDPIMAEISRLNRGSGQPIEHWARIADWRNLENVHFFRVPPTQADVDALAAFVGVEGVKVDTTPHNTRPDRLGLKVPYAAGEVPEELERQFKWLQSRTDVQALFRSQGYDLPWM